MSAAGRIGEMNMQVRVMLAQAMPPLMVGDIPVAPARGPMKVVPIWEAQAGGTRLLTGHRAEPADVFDTMGEAARARHDRVTPDSAYAPPFTPGQVYMARHYRALTERHSAGGMKCASLEGRQGGSGGEFMDAYLAEGRELTALHRKIGTGQAMVVRRVRPSARGSRSGIMDRRLVDMVCLGDMTLSAVLDSHGWTVDGKHREALRTALGGALDRMQGYRG